MSCWPWCHVCYKWCCSELWVHVTFLLMDFLGYSPNLENSAVTTGLERSVYIPIPKKDSAKECSNNCAIELISHASKVILKIIQAKLQQYMSEKL